MSSGGPFFRDIEVNDTGSAVNITHYMFSGHQQTEALRLGLHGPYALAVTDGAAPDRPQPGLPVRRFIPGLLSNAQRGGVSGTATGAWSGLPVPRSAWPAPTGQYWGQVKAGKFVIGHVRPGTYTATLYAGELAVGATKTVTVTAGATTTLAMTGNVPAGGHALPARRLRRHPGRLPATPTRSRRCTRPTSRMSAWTSAPYTSPPAPRSSRWPSSSRSTRRRR